MITSLRVLVALGFLIGGARSVAAQDSAVVEGPRAERLRQMIEDRFAERMTVELGLGDDQAAKVRGVLSTWSTRRRSLEKDERGLRQQLQAGMRPGVAADEKTVVQLTDRIMGLRIQYVETFRSELTDLSALLTPIQRAQYVLLRDRLMQRIQEVRNQRMEERPLGARKPGRLRP